MRTGQSSVEGMLKFTAVMLVLLGLCWWQFDRLLPLVNDVSIRFQETAMFDQIVEWVSE